MYCAVCGGQNADSAAVCKICGATLSRGLNAGGDSALAQPMQAAQPVAAVTPAVKPAACAVCATVLAPNDYLCRTCKTPRGAMLDPYAPVPGRLLHAAALLNPPPPPKEDVSEAAWFAKEIPPEASGGWNWGAFWLPFFWGLAHRTFQTLIVFVLAVVGFVVMMVLAATDASSTVAGVTSISFWIAGFPFAIWYGMRGNEWAWRNRGFKSVDEFRTVQRIWGNWAKILFLLNTLAIAVTIVVAALNG